MQIKKLVLSTLAVAVASFIVTACNDKGAQAQDNATKATTAQASITAESPFEEKAAYAIGASVGGYIAHMQKEQGEIVGTLNQDLIVQGFLDSLKGNPVLDEKQITDTLVQLDEKVRTALEKMAQEKAQKNLEEGKKFLEENAKKEGVKTTESGLQYSIVKEGTGKTPTEADTVKVKYKGTTIDGKVFDEATEPVTFPLSGIIPGWIEGLQLMKEGAQFKLFVPSELAYGETGAGNIILPNSVLIFDIELIEVEKPQVKEEAQKEEKK